MSELVDTVLIQVRALGLPQPEKEYRFHPQRKYRFDLAWPGYRLAVEVDGGAYTGGRHTRGPGFRKDCEKLNEAILLGWRVMRAETNMVKDGTLFAQLERFFRGRVF
ncbi:MAG: hypothetical protein RBS34_12885 [Desulfofustis sp.]|jgi:very-short-patch-repair endonuclease|nr:hypothetical protein [Desulfofustis sp.]